MCFHGIQQTLLRNPFMNTELHSDSVITYLLIYSMDQGPSLENDQFLVSQEFPRNLWNPKVHYRNYKCPPTVPNLSHLGPGHTTQSHFKIHLNIIFQPMTGFSMRLLFLMFPHRNALYTSPVPYSCYMQRIHNHSRFHHPNNIW